MKKTILISSFVLAFALLSKGQFSYFNNYYLPPEWEEDNSGQCSNLFVSDTALIAYGGIYANEISNSRFMFTNYTGVLLGDLLFPEDIENRYIQYNESAKPFLDGDYIWGGSGVNYAEESQRPLCVRFNSDFSEQWKRQVTWPLSDTTTTFEYHFATPLSNGDVFCAGPIYYNIDDDNWSDISGMIVGRYTADGDSIYEKIIPFWQEQYQEFNEFILRVVGAIELDNGDILISGIWNDNGSEPCFIKVSAEGGFLSQFKFDIICHDGYPWMVPLENDHIAFAYSKCIDTFFPDDNLTPIRNIRVGEFDPMSMDTVWTKTFDYTYFCHQLHDFVPTPDGGYAALSFTYGSLDESEYTHDRGAFILKLDSAFNEEWFRFYDTPIPSRNNSSLSAYDLEVTPDGGFAVLGNFMPEDEDYYVTWLFKTDCMGFLAPPDMQLFSNVEQLNDSTFYCTASGEAYQNFVWDFGNGDVVEGDTIMYVYDESGEFEIVLNASSCLAEADSSWSVTATVSITESQKSENSKVKIYPNPATSTFTIECNEVIHYISIKDISGRIVFSSLEKSKFVQLDVSQLRSGMYLLEVDLGNGKISAQKVVVE